MIRNAIKEDAKNLHLLENRLFNKDDGALSLRAFQYHIRKNELFVLIENNSIVGYILWLKRKSYYRLYSIAIDPNHQGKGLSKELLNYSFNVLQSLSYQLEVNTKNSKATTLYEKFGFKTIKILKDFYTKDIDAYLMIKKLTTNS